MQTFLTWSDGVCSFIHSVKPSNHSEPEMLMMLVNASAIGFVFASPTKSFNLAGVSMTAYCLIPNKELREPYLKQLRDLKLDEPPIPSLVATIAAYTEGAPWLQSLREYLQGNVQEVVDFFSFHDFGIKAIPPQASFLVWLDCRAMELQQEELMRFFSDKAGSC